MLKKITNQSLSMIPKAKALKLMTIYMYVMQQFHTHAALRKGFSDSQI